MIIQQLTKELNLREKQVQNTVQLLDEGNTIPFIARYRKEVTGELNEEVLRQLEERLNYLRALESRKEEVIRIIGEQEKLTPELEQTIRKAVKLQEVEDLYRPYKPKRRTRASIAKEKGLEPLAMMIYDQVIINGNIEELVTPFVSEELGVTTVEEALQGAMDIVAEIFSDDAGLRKFVREITLAEGILEALAKKEGEVSAYEMYYEYKEPVVKLPPHRILAINRGEKEEFLAVKIAPPVEKILAGLLSKVMVNQQALFRQELVTALEDAYKRLIQPSIEREIRAELTVKGEEQAIKVFAANLKNLLLQPPVRGQVVLGLDPGFRTGCKVAVVDEIGKVLDLGVIYPHPPQKKWDDAKDKIKDLVKKHGVNIITIGNGTASRETEAMTAEIIGELAEKVVYIIVSEAGASVYSASKLAAQEFPDLDVSMRSAISIARRLQDPLAELVKIEPKAVGVGQYQHDVTPKELDQALTGVVESAVNSVGVDLNTASPALLQYVAGIKPAIAKSIVAFREAQGRFVRREQLKKVPRLGEQTFIQCAGFLRLPEGLNPLENTPVHPESYGIAKELLNKIGHQVEDIRTNQLPEIRVKLNNLDLHTIAEELGAGLPTLRDIVEALSKPGRDPRDELPKPLFHQEVTSLANLKPGMLLQGTVRNVVDFGAFVDIGVKHDGLVHISQLSNKFIKHPMEAVAVGDIVNVKVLSVDMQRERVSLTMKDLQVV